MIFFLVPVQDTNIIETTDVLLLPGDRTTIHWSPDSIIEPNLQEAFAVTMDYSVDISLYQLDFASENYVLIEKIATNIPNTGTYEITIPSIDPSQSENFTVGVIGISISEQFNSWPNNNVTTNNVLSLLKRAPKFGLTYVATSLVARSICSEWHSSEPDNIGETILNRLPPCPPVRDAALNDPNYSEEDLFLSFFHPGASSCFRQVVFTRYVQYSYVIIKFKMAIGIDHRPQPLQQK